MAQASPADGPSFESSELGTCCANYHGYAQSELLGRGRHPGDREGSPSVRRAAEYMYTNYLLDVSPTAPCVRE